MEEFEPNHERKLSNIAIFWDIENVTPKRGSFFTDGLLEYAQGLGKVLIQNAYADWSEKRFNQLGLELAQHHFYMVHLPYRRNQRSKNGADIQLVSDALDSLRVYEHIDTYFLVTGDSDFRPLLRPLHRMGKTIHIICDIRNASRDLLMIADNFLDYHELLPSRDDDDELENDVGAPSAKENGKGNGKANSKSGLKDSKTIKEVPNDQKSERKERDGKGEDHSYWFNQLCEAVLTLDNEDKTINLSSLRIQMRMLNPGFDELKLGFRRWSQFIAAAVKNNYIAIENRRNEASENGDNEEEQIIRVVEQDENSKMGNNLTLQKAMQAMIAILQQVTAVDGRIADKDADAEGYLLYGILSSRLREREINVRDLGFRQFKKFMASAEARGLIETKVENMNYSARLVPEHSLSHKQQTENAPKVWSNRQRNNKISAND